MCNIFSTNSQNKVMKALDATFTHLNEIQLLTLRS